MAKPIDPYKLSKRVLKDIQEEKAHKERLYQIEHPKAYAFGKAVDKGLQSYASTLASYKPTSRRVFKKDKQATVVYRGSNPHSHFKQEFDQSKVSWLSGGI